MIHRFARSPLLLVSAAAGVAVFPLLVHGPSYGHDFNFHLLSWMEAARQFSGGTLRLHWAYSPAYNAGEPRFVFYPPLSWTLGGLLGLIVRHLPAVSPEAGWTAVPILFTWICLTLSGLTMYRLARAFAGDNASRLAAVLYVVNPYMLFTVYERTAYAELLAAAWIPLLLLALLSVEVRATRVAIPIALLWLTNAPAAVIACYTTVLLVLLRAGLLVLRKRSPLSSAGRTLALPAALGGLLGLALAGLYFIPAAWERRFVQVSMATIVNMRIDHNFLFERTGTSLDAVTHDQVLRTACWVAVSLLLSTVLLLMACYFRQRGTRTSQSRELLFPLEPLLLLILLIGFLLTGWSIPVWQHTPELLFLQFPWRLLVVVAPICALALSVAISHARISRTAATAIGLLSAAVLVGVTYKPFRQFPEANQTISASVMSFEQNRGAEPTDEYTPQTADNDALTPGNPPYWFAQDATAPAPPNSQPGPAPNHFNVAGHGSDFLILNLRDYPAWQVFVNGELHADRSQRDDGLVAFRLPVDASTIDLNYRHTTDEITGDAMTVISLMFLGVLFTRNRLVQL